MANGDHWVGVKLIGGLKSPRDAIGAKVFLTAGGVRQRADVFSGGSYDSRRQKNGPISGAKSKEANGRDVQERHLKVLLPLKEQLAMGREHRKKKRIELIDCASFLIS